MKVKPCEAFYLGFFIRITIVTEALMFYNSGHMVLQFWRKGFEEGQEKKGKEGRLLLPLQWNEYIQLSHSGVSYLTA